MGDLLQDLRYAVRTLRKSPAFTAVAVLTLALGIGFNTAIFSIIDAVLLRPLPFAKPGELVRLYETEDAPGKYPFTGPDFLDWKAQNHTFQDMTLIGWPHSMNLSGQGEPLHVSGIPAEANFFSLLGARPLLGRTFAPEEDQSGRERVVVLSYRLWQSHFGGDRGVIGRNVDLDGQAFTVIGVMPPNFRYPRAETQLWVPLVMAIEKLLPRGSHGYSVVGRLKPGVTLQQALADVSLIAANLEKQFPESNHKVGAVLLPLQESVVGQSRKSLMMMLWAVALVLLIACANVANLLLTRAMARQKEMAVRSALGAKRSRLVRQLLTESVLLSLVGGTAGLLIAGPCIALVGTAKHLGLPAHNSIELNATVMAFTFGLATLTGIVFGLVPALQTSRTGMLDELKGGAGSAVSHGKRRRLASDALVVSEVGLSLLLLISAGLLLKDFARLRSGNIGVRTQGVLTAAIALPENKYGADGQASFSLSQALLQRMSALPGVDSAAITDRLPLEGGSNSYATVRGQAFRPMSGPLIDTHSVTPGYFKVMGIPLLQGRVLNEQDVAAEVALDEQIREARKAKRQLPAEATNAMVRATVINQTMARTVWPSQNALGQMFSFGAQNGPWMQVVGIVADNKQWGLAQAPVPEEFSAYTGDSYVIVTLHTSLPPSTMAPPIRGALAELDSSLPLFSVRTMDDIIAEQAGGQQFLSLLVGLFAGLALLLATVGIYGVLSYVVTQRTREIGIRLSLGASRGHMQALILRQGLRLAVIGVAVGIVGAIAAGRVLADSLHEVKPADPVIMGATAVALGMVALLACYLPARRATKVDPMVALRYE
jgi:putative ABC transport system permease protein